MAVDEDPGQDFQTVGSSLERRDGRGHVTGQTEFVEDRTFSDMLHLVAVRSPVNHADVNDIDFSKAREVDGFVDVLTADDVPNNQYAVVDLIQDDDYGHPDEPLLSSERVRYEGEPMAAVIAETARAAREAAAKVEVDLTEREAVYDVEAALEDDAPVLTPWGSNAYPYHYDDDKQGKKVVRSGDVEAAFEEADHIVEGQYETSPIEQAPTETQIAIAKPEADGRFKIFTNTQALHFSLAVTNLVAEIPTEKLRVMGGTVGGGFGGKNDVIVGPMATLAAKKTGHPVKYKFNREEEMQASSPRGAWRLYIRDAVTDDGDIIGRKVDVYVDAGAYVRHTPYGAKKVLGSLSGPYYIPNCEFNSYHVCTNKQPSSSMRGFGVTGPSFADEVHLSNIAETVGMDDWELRMKNAKRRSQEWPHGVKAEDASAIEVMQRAAELHGIDLPEHLQEMSSFEEVEE
jgi:CO/xanthine dehydrogenase Mo-binding subunit